MKDKDRYSQIIAIQSPWIVADVELNLAEGEIKVIIEQEPDTELSFPKRGALFWLR